MKEPDIDELTIAEIGWRIKSKKVSPVALTERYLERIERLNPLLNAYVSVTADQALQDARTAEREIAAGKCRGPLQGIPFSIKDNIATQAVRTTAGSKILAEWVPDFDATAVARLRQAGAIILGKTNMHEWAAGSTTINPFYGTTRNPWEPTRISGGSSGGSAAAIAASLCLASLGTDNMGSVRIPAAFCGVIGLKPTYGRISRFGDVPGTGGESTDHFGILTKTVADCALVLETIAGHDPNDPLSANEPVPRYSKSITKEVKGLKLGLIKGYFEELMADELMVGEVKETFKRSVEVLASLGMRTEDVRIPRMNLVPLVQNCTSRVENVAAHIPHLKARARDYSQPLLYRQVCALTIPAQTYVIAQKVRRIICQEFDDALGRVDVIATPTVGTFAPTIDECAEGFIEVDGVKISLQDKRGNFGVLCTMPFNLTGLPAISICCGFSSTGLPIGLQLAGRLFEESTVLQVARAYEQAAGWYRTKPNLDNPTVS